MPSSLFDENAEVLRRFEADGVDLVQEREIDFSFVFPEAPLAQAFARSAQLEGFATQVRKEDGLEKPWDVTASKVMTPTCERITAIEQHLDGLARNHHGKADGWGFLGV